MRRRKGSKLNIIGRRVVKVVEQWADDGRGNTVPHLDVIVFGDGTFITFEVRV